jgi:hypothetical protein
MKKRLQLALAGLLLLVFSSIQANPDTIFLNTQTDVDNFQATYAITDNLPGGIIIESQGVPAITNLNGLLSIETIGTFLTIINNSDLTDISGLINLSSIGGTLTVDNNDRLEDFFGFMGGLVDEDKGQFARSLSFVGLESVQNLVISNNDSLTSLSGLENLESFGGFLVISNNPALSNISNLNGLTSIPSYLRISGNAKLDNVDGLIHITSIGSFLQIENNAVLSNVEGLSNITEVGGDLTILNNPMLADCRGISQLVDSIDDGAPGPSFDSTPDVGGSIFLSNNIASCSTIGEILLGYRVVTTQQEVNDLELGADNTIDGNLIIGPSTNITNLDNLMALEKVVGNLIIINNEGLEDFGQGLVNLDSVGCVVYIGCNDNLCNLENLGIATLLYVSSDLIVIDNPMLEDCCGLLPLFTMGTIVGGAIMFGNNPLGNCNRNGADISSSTCPFIPVPTLSQWGFFLFTCIIFTLAVVGLYNLKKVNLL